MVDGGAVVGFSARRAGGARQAAVLGEIRPHGDVPRQVDRAGPAPVLVSVALCRRADDGGGHQRTRLHGHRRLRQAGVETAGAPLRLAVPWKYGFKSIKSIVRFTFTDKRPEELLGSAAGVRIRLLGQRQSAGAASALEPGDRGSDRHQRAPADVAVQRLWRIRRRSLQGHRRASGSGRERRERRRKYQKERPHAGPLKLPAR